MAGFGDARLKKPEKGGMMTIKIKKPMTFLIRGLDPDLWRMFRAVCLEAGRSANQYIKDLIKREVDKKK